MLELLPCGVWDLAARVRASSLPTFASEQQDHNQPLEIGQFLWEFWQSTP